MEHVSIVLLSGKILDLEVGGKIDNSEGIMQSILAIDYNKCQTAIEIYLEGDFVWGIPLQTIANYTYS
jgi:hypothetical protein